MTDESRRTTMGGMDHHQAGGAGALTARVQAALHRVRAFDGRRPLVWDAMLTGFFVVAALTEAGGGWRNTAADPDVPSGLVTVLSLFLSVPLLWRRRHPLAVLAVMAPAALVSQWTGALLQAALIQQVAVFGVALRQPLRRLWWAVALLAPPLVVGAVRFPRDGWVQSVGAPLWLFALVVLGAVAVRTRREYTASLVERARRLEVERDQQARLAAAAERARIAREMHDIIGHNLSVITGLADGGRYAAAKSPERAAQALDGIASTSRQALTELRRLLGVLRDDPSTPGAPGEPGEPGTPTAPVTPPELAPQPALADLDELLEGVRAAGLPVRHTVRGEAPPLPPGRQLTVFRVVQEALTNTLKHAGPGATATVEVSYEDGGGVAVTVTDTGGGARTPPVPGPRAEGRGLTGMRERAALYEGALEAGPLPPPAAGWRVRLSLPKDAVT
ncbi:MULTISPECIES: sensor histidine kinase [Streptomyces]|uniref:histidine kinase n=2 Tax=Streptomyces fradiae ATCC 10745 = DSM 40063 TaxID=1319510 RepID=A0A1Y2NYU7_STRFR|nr:MULTISPECIES: histidine kinase [Streptomyces]OSY52510.1 Sensor histidine kinase DesK [Streptomyces fradiae ATCC 10745 = DSM 40063]